FDAGRAQDVRVAEAGEARALGMLADAGLEQDGAQRVGGAAGGTHHRPRGLRTAGATLAPAGSGVQIPFAPPSGTANRAAARRAPALTLRGGLTTFHPHFGVAGCICPKDCGPGSAAPTER